MAAETVRAGIDIGGTKVAIGLVDNQHKLVSDISRFQIDAYDSGDSLVKKIVGEVEELCANETQEDLMLSGIGLGSPGPLDLKTGTVLNTPNIPMLRDYPLLDSVKNVSGKTAAVNNDANCFALGEALAGEARKRKFIVGVTLGTGFGCGIILNKEIYVGATGTAAEIAHCPYEGRYLEDFISGRGLSRMYTERTGVKAKGSEIALRADSGDSEALDALKEFGAHLGRAFAYFVNLLDPDYIVAGGSNSKDWQFFSDSMHETLNKYINDRPRTHLQVVPSQLGESASIIGAAGLIPVER